MTLPTAYVVFDTETTGLPSRRFRKVTNANLFSWDSCRMVQLAWEIYYDNDPALVSSACYLVKTDGFAIPAAATNIHKITNEDAQTNGIPVKDVLNLFLADIKKFNVTTAVAHNIAFDENVLLSEISRANENVKERYKLWNGLQKHCTMRVGTKDGGKWPKLNALYTELIGPVPDSITLHCANDDARLCSAIYRAQQLQ